MFKRPSAPASLYTSSQRRTSISAERLNRAAASHRQAVTDNRPDDHEFKFIGIMIIFCSQAFCTVELPCPDPATDRCSFNTKKVGCTLFSVFTGQIMINHSQFCFRGILWFSHKIAPYSVGCPTFGVQSMRLRGPTDSQSRMRWPGKAPAATRHNKHRLRIASQTARYPAGQWWLRLLAAASPDRGSRQFYPVRGTRSRPAPPDSRSMLRCARYR
ncbi:hypothetical protein BANRA_02609 [Klebsiella pneumoniae]|nr:hypothetical protein BANRA_01571 [Klebsiella pneumoniae]VDA20342.1 hypothetical protein BANRA_02609 [Klebsiella pneumoniae]